jgi:hypothetical protein
LHRFTASNPFLAISKLSPNIFKILDINFNEILSSSATNYLIFVVQNEPSLAVVVSFSVSLSLIRGILKQNSTFISVIFCPYFTT